MTIFRFLKSFQMFEKFSDFLKVFRFFESFQIFWKFLWPETWHLRHWLHFWQLRTKIWTITLWPLNTEWWWQHSQFLRCLLYVTRNVHCTLICMFSDARWPRIKSCVFDWWCVFGDSSQRVCWYVENTRGGEISVGLVTFSSKFQFVDGWMDAVRGSDPSLRIIHL